MRTFVLIKDFTEPCVGEAPGDIYNIRLTVKKNLHIAGGRRYHMLLVSVATCVWLT